MNVGSLFSGIGGMDYGLARAGHRHVFFCESDPWRREVLAARWPGVWIFDDVHVVGRVSDRVTDNPELRQTAGQLGQERGASEPPYPYSDERIDLLCGGFPCQDVSVAGRRRGLAGERSGLFFEFARIIDALRPRWLLVENVPGLLSSNGGRDFGAVLGTLADLGYGVGWRVLDSRFFGVPQRRRRVFIVGTVADGDPRAASGRAGEVLAVGSRCPGHPTTGGEAGEGVAAASEDGSGSRVAGTLGSLADGGFRTTDTDGIGAYVTSVSENQRAEVLETPYARQLTGGGGKPGQGYPMVAAYHFRTREEGSCFEETDVNVSRASVGGSGGAKLAIHIGATVRRLMPVECERLQGLPDGWTQLGEKTPDSRRYSALGDAVTATVAEWIGRRLEAA